MVEPLGDIAGEATVIGGALKNEMVWGCSLSEVSRMRSIFETYRWSEKLNVIK